MTTLVLVAAVARNGVIGRGGVMPWHLPEDLAHFRRTTQGLPVLMGRRTWESLPERFRPLPGRRNIVVTRQAGWVAPGAEVAASPEAALALMADAPRACVIGGGELYAALLPRVDELVLTEIDADFDGDTHWPATDPARWRESAREHLPPAGERRFAIDFVTYLRRG